MQGTIKKEFLRYVSLNVAGMIGLSCYILADTYFVANGVGPLGLAALNLTIPAYSFMDALFLMLGSGGAIRYVILKASGRRRKADQMFMNILVSAIVIGVILAAVGNLFSGQLAALLGADKQTMGMTRTYVRVLWSFAPFFMVNGIFTAFIRNDGAPAVSMLALFLGSISNVIFDYVFVYPMNMGIFGAGLATGFSPVVGLVIAGLYMKTGKSNLRFPKCRFRIRNLLLACKLGMSALILEMSTGMVIAVYNLEILSIGGNLQVAAYGIVANTAMVVMSMFTGITQGIQPLVSYYFGRGHVQHARRILKWALLLAVLFAVVVYIGSYTNAMKMAQLFNSKGSETLASLASHGIRIHFLGFFFAGINVMIAAYLASIEQAGPSIVISLSRGLALIVLCVLVFGAVFGMNGVWSAFPAAELLSMGISLLAFEKAGVYDKSKR